MKIQRKNSGMDMLRGSLSGNIIRFALPLAGSSMLQQLFNAADTAIVGRFDGRQALAAVGSNTMVISLFVNMFVGLSIGANVVIAKYVGQRQEEKIKKSVHTVMFLAVLSGPFLLVFGQMTAEKILTLMQTPEDVMAQAVLYLKIYCLGMPFMMVYNFGAAVLRCKGDTRCSLYALILSGILNVGLNLLFVVAFKMGVAGVGIATVIANGVSGSLVCCFLMQEKGSMHLSVKAMQLDKKYLKEVLQVGIPAGIQGMCFSVANVCIQSAVNCFGAEGSAGFSIALTFESLTYYISNAFGQAAVTFTSQNYSVGNIKRCRQIFNWCLLLGGVLCESISLLFVAGHRWLIPFFTSDAGAAAYALIRMQRVVAFNGMTAGYEVGSGLLRAMGHSLQPALLVVVGCCGFRILWILTAFRRIGTFEILMNAYPLSWLVTDILIFVTYKYYITISTH